MKRINILALGLLLAGRAQDKAAQAAQGRHHAAGPQRHVGALQRRGQRIHPVVGLGHEDALGNHRGEDEEDGRDDGRGQQFGADGGLGPSGGGHQRGGHGRGQEVAQVRAHQADDDLAPQVGQQVLEDACLAVAGLGPQAQPDAVEAVQAGLEAVGQGRDEKARQGRRPQPAVSQDVEQRVHRPPSHIALLGPA